MKFLLISNNPHKLKEFDEICKPCGISIQPISEKIDEIQTDDSEKLVRDKVLKAFKIFKRPLLVEHTGLKIHDFGDLPGGLTQLFWDKLQADKFSARFGGMKVTAFTIIGLCDEKRIHFFEGKIGGVIVSSPRGNSAFQWDVVFQPDGYDQTFAEMGPVKKNEISMRKSAITKLADYVTSGD
jgi:XTP/dITP diphosphohydrolase